MRTYTAGILLLLLALVLAAASGGACQRMSTGYVHYEGTGPGLDSMRVVVGGWPLPYLRDMPYAFSPANRVDIAGGVLGLDELDAGAFLADVLFYWALAAGLAYAGRAVWRRAGHR